MEKNQRKKEDTFTYNPEMIVRHFNQMQEMYISEHNTTQESPNIVKTETIIEKFSIKEDESDDNENQLSGDLKFINNNLSEVFDNKK